MEFWPPGPKYPAVGSGMARINASPVCESRLAGILLIMVTPLTTSLKQPD
jgi:hypothetical protein